MKRDDCSWRIFLGEIIRDPQEKQRLAEAMEINPVTLARWVNAGLRTHSNGVGRGRLPRPQRHSLLKLVAALPDNRDLLISSIIQEFPELTEDDFLPKTVKSSIVSEITSIPVSCYELVLEAAMCFSGELRCTSIFGHLFHSALQQLDPDRVGVVGSVLQCTRPLSEYKVRSLRETYRIGGVPPWRHEERNIFRGAESLPGHAVTTCGAYEIDDVRVYSGWLPIARERDEVSVAVCPIQRMGLVAGCLFFACAHPHFFSKEHARLIRKYSHLALEAFDEVDYYPQQEIELRLMPSIEAQEPFLHSFNKLVEEVLARGEVTSRGQAVQIVMHQLENNLITRTSNHSFKVSRLNSN